MSVKIVTAVEELLRNFKKSKTQAKKILDLTQKLHLTKNEKSVVLSKALLAIEEKKLWDPFWLSMSDFVQSGLRKSAQWKSTYTMGYKFCRDKLKMTDEQMLKFSHCTRYQLHLLHGRKNSLGKIKGFLQNKKLYLEVAKNKEQPANKKLDFVRKILKRYSGDNANRVLGVVKDYNTVTKELVGEIS